MLASHALSMHILFLQWDGESGPRLTDDSLIRSADSTFQMIRTFAHRMAAAPRSPVPGCVPRRAPAPSASAQQAAGSNGTTHLLDFGRGGGRRLLREG